MESTWRRIVFILSVISCIYAKNSYVAMFPKVIRPNLFTNVNIQLLQPYTGPVTATVSLLDDKNMTIVSASATSDGGGSRILSVPLKIPSTLTAGKEYAIQIEGSGGLKFSNYSKVEFKSKYSSIMIQTDKAIYKPGQTVQFRVFGIYPDLTVVEDNIDVDIFDPQGNKMAQWTNEVPDNGVFTNKMVMSTHPVLGEWTIKAVQGKEAYKKTFTVDEYVLPKFEVTLDLPPYGLTNRNLTGLKVIAKYTFGKPVKGTVDIRIRPPYISEWSRADRKRRGLLDEISHSAKIDGEYKFDVEISKLKRLDQWLDYSDILFEANVTEALTGLRQNASGTVKFYSKENKVEFFQSLPKTYKPGLKYMVLGKVTRQDDSPIPLPTASRVKLSITHTYPLPTTTTESPITTTPGKRPPGPEGKVLIEPMIPRRIMPPWQPTTKDVELDPIYKDVDIDGVFSYEMDVPDNVKRVSINAQYEDSTAYLSLNPGKSPSDNFIQVTLQKSGKKPQAGTPSSFEIKTTEMVPKVYYQVISKGQLITSGDVDMQAKKMQIFTLPITTEMAPKARMIVHYVRDDGEIVTDALTFNIEGTFKNKVDIDFDVKEARPGSDVLVNVKADPGSTMHLLAVDKSVLILRSDNDIKESRINDELDSYDNGAGGGFGPFFRSSWIWPMPSGGEDAEDVFKNNGMIVLTDALLYNFEEPWLRQMPMFRNFAMMEDAEAPVMAMAAPVPMMAQAVPDQIGSAPAPSNPAPTVRKLFPETWLWTNSTAGIRKLQDMMAYYSRRLVNYKNGMPGPPESAVMFMDSAPAGGSSQINPPVVTVRKLFPETWLWSNKSVGSIRGYCRQGTSIFCTKNTKSVSRELDLEKHYYWVYAPPVLYMYDMVLNSETESRAMKSITTGGSLNKGRSPARSGLQIRKLFPETWIWFNKTTGPDGKLSLNVPVPDTITSWVATAFAVNSKTGLGLSPSPANLKVFMPFFVTLTLPYSVQRGELVVLQANVFNYLDRDVRVLVIIDKNEGWKNLVTYIQNNQVKKGRFSARVGRTFNMTAGEIYPVYFPIIPTKTGELKINITVFSTGPSDAVIRTLRVEPEGTEKEFNNPVLINTDTTGRFSEDVDISFPTNTVEGSRRIRASAIGDIMGPSISGLDKLLKMPYGCGEQNMLNFAPNIFVQKYLTTVNNLSPDMEAKAREYMIKGYQREMTYRHPDGSFSAFGESDKSGTTWLTAFVVKSFSQASKFILIDDEVIKKSVKWLTDQQNENGTFREPGRVLHKEMQGASATGPMPLTAFVLIALKEAEVIPGVSEITGRAVQKAKTYLEGDVPLLEDVYELALVGYALQLAGSTMVPEIMGKLNAKAVTKDGTKYWSKPETGIKWKGWAPIKDQAKAVDIETTSYVLLLHGINKELDSGLPVLKWITAQRNPEGGFASTQDTVIALQGLSEFAGMVYSPNFNMLVTLTSKTPGVPFQHQFRISPENALVLQTVDVPKDVRTLGVVAEGSGIALVEVANYFNIAEDLQIAAFDVNVTIPEKTETMQGFVVKVCGRWLREGNSGMAMMDIGIPSGMTPDLDSLDTSMAPMYKRREVGYRKLSLYFDEFDSQPQCASVYMANTDKVAEKQPSVVRLYDYYEPKNQATTFYQSKVMSKSGLCDVCEEECFCPAKR